MKMNNFQGELTDISAKKRSTGLSSLSNDFQCFCFQNVKKRVSDSLIQKMVF